MSTLINTTPDICKGMMWVLVFFIEAAFLFATFNHPDAIKEFAAIDSASITLALLGPVLVLIAYETPFIAVNKH